VKLGITWNENLVTARTHARLLKEAAEAAMIAHRDLIMPNHFTTTGARKYRFKKRAKGTMINKARKYGHQNPNVMTGAMREIVRSQTKITRTQYGARMYVRNYFPLTADRRREMEVVQPDEEQGHAARIRRFYLFSANDPKNMRKRRVKIRRK
jgi:hypothetical protein